MRRTLSGLHLQWGQRFCVFAKVAKVTHRVKVKTQPFACMLGGPDRRTLFVLTAETMNPDEARAKKSGRIETVRVEVPGAGLP